MTRNERLRTAASGVYDWITNWEVLGVKYNKPQDAATIDVESIVDELIINMADFVQRASGQIDGVLLLLDEADAPPVEANLGKTLKLISERLGRERCYKVLFGLAGLPNLLGKMFESHESSPRLFHTMLLEPLEIEERKKVVEMGLESANQLNTQTTEIEVEALDFLAELSEGYPHFLQQFAFSAFASDSDDYIDFDDVGAGAFQENGALSQLGDKFFNQMYNARISSEDYRRVLDAMAEYADGWVTRKTIIAESGVVESSVTNALKALRDREIIVADDARRGHYRLPTRSFAAWINATKAAAAKRDVEESS